MLFPADTISEIGDVEAFHVSQNVGDLVVTFPRCFHQVMNGGDDISEVFNFMPSTCLEYAVAAKRVGTNARLNPLTSDINLRFAIRRSAIVNASFRLILSSCIWMRSSRSTDPIYC
jgi:hypothetical protein